MNPAMALSKLHPIELIENYRRPKWINRLDVTGQHGGTPWSPYALGVCFHRVFYSISFQDDCSYRLLQHVLGSKWHYWIFPWKMVIFHSYISLPEGNTKNESPRHGYHQENPPAWFGPSNAWCESYWHGGLPEGTTGGAELLSYGEESGTPRVDVLFFLGCWPWIFF